MASWSSSPSLYEHLEGKQVTTIPHAFIVEIIVGVVIRYGIRGAGFHPGGPVIF